MATYREILTRGQQTVGVRRHFSPALSLGPLTLAAHEADVAAMPGADQTVVDAEAVIDDQRDARNTVITRAAAAATGGQFAAAGGFAAG